MTGVDEAMPVLAHTYTPAQLNDNLHEIREDLQRWNGAWMVIWHPGLATNDFDVGWSMALAGCGGWPDSWVRGVIELPWSHQSHWEKTGG